MRKLDKILITIFILFTVIMVVMMCIGCYFKPSDNHWYTLLFIKTFIGWIVGVISLISYLIIKDLWND